jgi:pimeloyl-ACP methyl ester carboxylesterase
MATFLVCHGAWSAGWAWKKVRPLLQAAGHDIYTPTYTGLGERAHLASPIVDLDWHIGDVLAVLHYEDLRDVILVAHSYGGMVATGVADRAGDRVGRLIYLDAYIPSNGQCQFDLLPPQLRVAQRTAAQSQGDGWLIPAPPPPADTSPADVAWINERRRWQPIRTFTQSLVLENANAALPRSYIYCTRVTPEDRLGPFARRAKLEPGWKYFEIDASHSPHITAPDALVRLLEQCLH